MLRILGETTVISAKNPRESTVEGDREIPYDEVDGVKLPAHGGKENA
jgi:hypothetical protein